MTFLIKPKVLTPWPWPWLLTYGTLEKNNLGNGFGNKRERTETCSALRKKKENQFLCCLQSIAAHRDHWHRLMSYSDKCFHISNWKCVLKKGKDYFGLKWILSYYVPVQTIVSPFDANCVTPLIYPTTDLDFLFGIIVSFDLSFYSQPF